MTIPSTVYYAHTIVYNPIIFLLGKEVMHEKNKEIDAINKEHQRQIQILVEDHAKEVDVSSHHYL